MTGLIVEFADDVTEDEEEYLYADPEEREGWIRVPRSRYLALLESAQKARAEWLLRVGAEFVCDTCKSFIVPAKAVIITLLKMERVDLDDPESFLSDVLCRFLTKPFPMNDDDWKAYGEGLLRHIPFLYDDKGDLVFVYESGPQILAYDEVVFKFRRECVCDGVYKRMYENIVRNDS